MRKHGRDDEERAELERLGLSLGVNGWANGANIGQHRLFWAEREAMRTGIDRRPSGLLRQRVAYVAWWAPSAGQTIESLRTEDLHEAALFVWRKTKQAAA